MNKQITIYHGSKQLIEVPVFGEGRKNNDFGLGFYCTESNELAKEWAVSSLHDGFSNCYTLDTQNMKILNLNCSDYSILNWMAVLVEHRLFNLKTPVARRAKRYLTDSFGINVNAYDLIIGYRADDSYFDYAEAFLNNGITVEQLARAMKLGKLGEQIASPIVNARDNARIDGEWGSYATDDEGNTSSDLLLIENGILKNYLVDELGARRMNCKPTGCSRRQDYSYAPTSRMSNTYICNGESDPKDIIANTEYGLYATQMGGGSVDTSTGDFNFAVNEGFMVRNGKIDEPVRGATLIGKGQEILKNIDMVGNDLALAAGMCGSVSGGVPVTVGQPTIRVSSILVGGRES